MMTELIHGCMVTIGKQLWEIIKETGNVGRDRKTKTNAIDYFLKSEYDIVQICSFRERLRLFQYCFSVTRLCIYGLVSSPYTCSFTLLLESPLAYRQK